MRVMNGIGAAAARLSKLWQAAWRGVAAAGAAAALAACGGGGTSAPAADVRAAAGGTPSASLAAQASAPGVRARALAVSITSPVYISELLASNNAGLQDEDGAYSDWFELRNTGPDPVNLTGWTVRDGGTSGPWTFPAVTIPAGGYLVVFASSKNRAVPGANLHTNFALGAGGEYLGLSRPDGTVAHEYAPAYPAQTANVSYGVDANGELRFFSTPTPGAANPVGDAATVNPVAATPARGVHAAPVNVTLASSTAGASIRYTLDGSLPSATNGTLYSAPILLSTTTTVRAVALAAGLSPSSISTDTYVFPETVGAQGTGIPGFPNGRTVSVGNGSVPEDTAMDTKVVGDPTYGPRLPAALRAIPTMAVTAPVGTIFGTAGFYDNDDLEVPVSVEVLYPNDPAANAQVNAGAESHSHNRLKRSVRINFRSAYGATTWNNDFLRRSPLNGASATTAIKTLVLRGGNNRAWSRDFNPDRTDFTLDQWYRDSQIAMQGVGSHGTFVHLYLNGVYWGLYNAVERPDEDFAASYGTGSDTDYFFINHGGATNGDPARWNYLTTTLATRDMSVAANYTEFREYLDVQAFADYMLLCWWMGITDWPTNNFYVNFKTSLPTSAARYFAWDGEWSMDRKQGTTHQGAWVHPEFQPGSGVYSTLGGLWKAAWSSPEFRVLFAQRVALHTAPGGALTDASMLSRYDTLNAFVRDAVIGESARWGDSLASLGLPLRTRDVDWQNAVNAIRTLTVGNTDRLIAALTAAGYYSAPDGTPPTITSVAPATGATNVPISATVQVGFSEAVALNGGLSLSTSSGAPVAATVSVSGRTATLTPSGPLAAGTGYRINVSTAVKDLSGNPLSSAFSSGFTTATGTPPPPPPSGDSPELKVSRLTTRASAVALSGNNWLAGESVYVFLDVGAATSVRFYLDTPTTGTPVRIEGAAPWDFAGGATAAASPYVNRLATGTHTIRALLTRADGTTQTYQASFTSGATTPPPTDTTPPTVISVSPANGATGVATGTAVAVTFSEAVVPNGGVTLAVDGGAAVAATVSVSGSTVRLTPQTALAASTRYRVSVGTAVRDAAGNPLATASSTTFTTATPPPSDTTPPAVVSVSPANGATGVATGTAVAVTISEAVVPNGGVTLAVDGGAAVAATVSVSGSTVQLTPQTALAASTRYRVSVGTAVRDAAGNPLATASSTIFTTAAAPPPSGGAELKVSRLSSRLSAVALGGNVWQRNEAVYVFLDVATPAISVRFYLDTPTTGTPVRIEGAAPWDFAGGTNTVASAYVNRLATGNHTIRALLTRSDGTTQTFQATFTSR